MKQSAIEWLLEELIKDDFDYQQNAIKKAKEMEKQQIMKAYFCGWDEELKRSGEQYYNETFKKETH